jgi:hypothetical protein
MKRLKLTLWCIVMFCAIQALRGQSRWINSYFGDEDTWGEDFIEYYDNGLLLTGKHGSNYVHYLWLIKTDVNGQILWEKTFGESNSLISFYSLDINKKGEIYLSGATSFYDPYRDPIVMKLNFCGEKVWCRVFNIPNHYDYAHSIVATDDGGCAVLLKYTGVPPPPQTDRICLAKFDSNGYLLWKHCYNSQDPRLISEDSRSILITPDHGFLITATCDYLDIDSTQMYWPKHYYIKTDSLGNFEWETVVHANYNLAGGDAWTTTLSPDSSFYYSSVSHYYYETNYSSPALIKLDLQGNVIDIYDIVNGYINGGLTYGQFINDSTLAASCVFGNTQDDITTLAVLIDTLGNIIDSTDLGPNIHKKVLQLTFDNKLLYFYDVLQNDQFDVYLRKLNLDLEDDTIYTMPFTYDSLCPYPIVSDTIVQDDCGLIVGIPEEEEKGRGGEVESFIELWPNPASTVLSFKVSGLSSGRDYYIEIYDIFGRQAPTLTLPDPGEGDWSVNVSSWPPGLYLLVVKDRQEIKASAKFLVAH